MTAMGRAVAVAVPEVMTAMTLKNCRTLLNP
jgi:hypothetical protein